VTTILTSVQKDMELLVLENLEKALRTGKLVTQVPEQISSSKL